MKVITIYNMEPFCRLLGNKCIQVYSALIYPYTVHYLHPATQKVVNPWFLGVLTYNDCIISDVSLHLLLSMVQRQNC